MAINQLTTANTFGDWLITTNNLVAVANSLTDGGINTYITRSFAHANASYAFANTINVRYQSAYDVSNIANATAYIVHTHANAAFLAANVANAFISTINVHNQSAYDQSNTTNGSIQNTFLHANAAFNQSNSANSVIYYVKSNVETLNIAVQSAFDQSNNTNLFARSAYTHTNAAFDFANTVNVKTQTAYDFANTVNVRVQSAYNTTNSAATIANTDFTSISVTAGTYGGGDVLPVIQVQANGRISAISNTPFPLGVNVRVDNTSSTDQFLLFSATTGVTQNLKLSTSALTFKPSTNTLTITNVAVTGAITENVYTLTANGTVSATIDPKFGTIQILTLANSGNATINHNIQTGQSVTIFIPPTTQTAPTWAGTIVWRDNTAPQIQGSRYTGVKLVNGGVFVYGIKLSE
jgi:hypothetical protein